MVKYEEETGQKPYLFEIHLIAEEEIVPLRIFPMKGHMPSGQAVLQIVEFPHDVPKYYFLVVGLGVTDEGVALVGGAGCEEQVEGESQLRLGRSQLEVQDGLEELCCVYLPCAFEFPWKQLTLLAREVVLQQVLLESFGEFEGQFQGEVLQGEVQLVLLVVLEVWHGLVAHVMQLQTLGAQLIEAELFLHTYLQRLAFFLPQAFQLIMCCFLEVVYFQRTKRSPRHYAFCKTGLRVEEIEGSQFCMRMREFISQDERHEHLRTISHLHEHLSLLP